MEYLQFNPFRSRVFGQSVIPGAKQWARLILLALTLLTASNPALGNSTAGESPPSPRTASIETQLLPTTLAELDQALDRALAESRPDYLERLMLVAHSDQQADRTQEMAYKTRLVEAVAFLRLGRFVESWAVLDPLCDDIDPAGYSVFRFRCLSLQASLLLIKGERQASLDKFETLFAGDLDEIPSGYRSRARINYATALNENGRAAEAADLYEQIIVDALAEQDDLLTLYAVNNLCVILVAQGDHLAARSTLDEMQPVVLRNPNSMVIGSLELLDYELIRVAGDPERAITHLQRFIDRGDEFMPLMLGSAHKTLADALRDVNRLDTAEYHARRAMDLLSDQAHERTDARIGLAQILLKRGDHDAVLSQLEQIDLDAEAVPARLATIHRLRLEALLRSADQAELLAEFDALIAADSQRDLLASTTRSEYFEARLAAAETSRELKQAEGLAAAALEQIRNDQRNRSLSLALMAAAAIGICLLVISRVNRLAERRRLVAQQQQNEELELRIEQKTRELTKNLNARTEMERAFERKKRTEAVGVLAGNVAHDFNNLLQVIASGNEMLERPEITAVKKAELLALSKGSLDHATRIIRQLLAYSRQQDLAARPAQFSSYLNDTQALLRAALGERHVLGVEDDSGAATILVDTTQLTTSLLNLISNAADAMPKGGRVTLSAQTRFIDAQQAQHWSDVVAGDYLIVGVRDSGIGMTARQVAQAHEPFFTTKGAQSGTGLGLSSVYGFVKQSGGDLKIHSVPDEGTLVQFVLPLTIREAASVPQSEAPAPLRLAGRRMLLVEDNDTVASMLEALLQNLQLRVVRVRSGQLARAHLQADAAFDFILSDVHMPGALDGPALARWVQAELPEVSVLLMSGFSELGPFDADLPLIRKPFNVAQLTQFIREHCQPGVIVDAAPVPPGASS